MIDGEMDASTRKRKRSGIDRLIDWVIDGHVGKGKHTHTHTGQTDRLLSYLPTYLVTYLGIV